MGGRKGTESRIPSVAARRKDDTGSRQVRISFTDQLPYYINQTPYLMSDRWAVGGLVWGSFDGSTNTPVIYPNYIWIQELENQVLQPPPGPGLP